MKFKDIIWPWGAIGEARAFATRQRQRADFFERENKNLLIEMNARDEAMLDAHFRNPATGRLGRKGERFAKA
jgi:hypothetical protein